MHGFSITDYMETDRNGAHPASAASAVGVGALLAADLLTSTPPKTPAAAARDRHVATPGGIAVQFDVPLTPEEEEEALIERYHL